MNRLRSIFALCIILFISGCNSQQPATSTYPANTSLLTGKLVITGSSTIAPLASELARLFEIEHTQTKIDVQTGGSSRGMTDVRQGVSNIGMVSRALKIEEKKDLTGYLIAKDGVSIIVNNNNPILELSESQIKDIYLGKISNWKTLGGADKKITVINKAEGRSTLEVFTHFFQLKNSQIKPDIIIGDNEQAIKLVARNLHAIAYVSIGTAEYDMNLGVPIKTLPLKGVPANSKTLLNGEFPLSRELNFVTKGKVSALAKAFIKYTQSDTALTTKKGFGFVSAQP